MSKILVVDDEQAIRALLEATLRQDGHEIIQAVNGVQVLKCLDDSIDLVILDVMMPYKDGVTTCLEIRAQSQVPVIFLTAKTQDTDQILGLTAGADDYLKKPFVPSVLQAKVKAMLRRTSLAGGYKESLEGSGIRVEDLTIDHASYQVFRDGQEIILTKKEFDILYLLASYRGQVFSTEKIYQHVWEEAFMDVSSNTVMVHIKKLRDKLEKGVATKYIKTVWGVGYKIDKI